MNTTEPNSIEELIADCAEIPKSLSADDIDKRAYSDGTPARGWTVTSTCQAQVAAIDLYV